MSLEKVNRLESGRTWTSNFSLAISIPIHTGTLSEIDVAMVLTLSCKCELVLRLVSRFWRLFGLKPEELRRSRSATVCGRPRRDRSTGLREACVFSLTLKDAGFTDSTALRLLRFGNIQVHMFSTHGLFLLEGLRG